MSLTENPEGSYAEEALQNMGTSRNFDVNSNVSPPLPKVSLSSLPTNALWLRLTLSCSIMVK